MLVFLLIVLIKFLALPPRTKVSLPEVLRVLVLAGLLCMKQDAFFFLIKKPIQTKTQTKNCAASQLKAAMGSSLVLHRN